MNVVCVVDRFRGLTKFPRIVRRRIKTPRAAEFARGSYVLESESGLTDEKSNIMERGEHRREFNLRVDDTTTYIRICIRMFAVNANAVARERSINQFEASPQARGPSNATSGKVRSYRSPNTAILFHFFFPLFLLFPLSSLSTACNKRSQRAAYGRRRRHTRARPTRINYNRLTLHVSWRATPVNVPSVRSRYIRRGPWNPF